MLLTFPPSYFVILILIIHFLLTINMYVLCTYMLVYFTYIYYIYYVEVFTIWNNQRVYYNPLPTHTILILVMVGTVDHPVSHAWLLFDIFASHRCHTFCCKSSMQTNVQLDNPLGVVKFVFCVSLMHNCGLCYSKLLSYYFLAIETVGLTLYSWLYLLSYKKREKK